MPKLSAYLSFQYQNLPFLNRFAAAASAKGVPSGDRLDRDAIGSNIPIVQDVSFSLKAERVSLGRFWQDAGTAVRSSVATLAGWKTGRKTFLRPKAGIVEDLNGD